MQCKLNVKQEKGNSFLLKYFIRKKSILAAAVNKEDGLLKWKLNIEPGKAEKLNFRYSVKYPKKQLLVLE